jgi:hypothetical protein
MSTEAKFVRHPPEETHCRTFGVKKYGSNEPCKKPCKLANQNPCDASCQPSIEEVAPLAGQPMPSHEVNALSRSRSPAPISCTQHPCSCLGEDLLQDSEEALPALKQCMARVVDLSGENSLLKYRLAMSEVWFKLCITFQKRAL